MMGASIPANGQKLRLTRNWQREIQPAGHKGRRGPASAAPNGWDQGIESVGPPGGSLKLRYDAGVPTEHTDHTERDILSVSSV